MQPGSGARPRLVLADDHRMVGEALSRALAQWFDVAAVVFTGDDLLRAVPVQRPDCVLLDLEMPGRNGLSLIPLLLRAQAHLRILIVTMLSDRTVADACLAAGARGFVPKDATSHELCEAVTAVLADRRYVSSRVPKATHRVGLGASNPGLHRLTPRQQEIVLLLGEGRSAAAISKHLGVGPSTITFHKHNIMRKLGVESDAGLVRYAVLMRAGSDVS